ncbi:MAG: T9SS type A sorting domain-containing protein [Prevotella sp.]|nr:T9SS type A sorting domain-containing protein [Prevotella sp.]
MRKLLLLTVTVFMCFTTALCQTQKEPEVTFEYPFKQSSPEWRNFKNSTERIAALQIPQDVVSRIPTDDLLRICLDFPYLSDMLAYNNLDMGFKAMSSKFNGFEELFNRINLIDALLKKYEKISSESLKILKTSDEKKGEFSFQIYVLTYILGMDCVIKKMSDSQLATLLKATKYNIEQMNDELSETFGYQAIKQMQKKLRHMRSQTELSEGNIFYGNNGNYQIKIKRTPNGSPVISGELITSDLSDIDKSYFRVLVENNYGAIYVSEATLKYNCHAYAWYINDGHPSDLVWIGLGSTSHENVYWEDGSYIEVPETIATRISYDEATADHSAVKYDSNRYISKWGAWPLVIHYSNEVPYNTSHTKKFYIRSPQLSAPSTICTTTTAHIDNFPTGCTVNWSVSNNCVQIISGQGTDSVTLQRNDDGWATLTATISHNGTVVKTLSKEIMVGTPAFCMNVIPVAADGSQGYWRSDLNGNSIDVEFVNSNARYPNYVVDLYRIDNGFSVGTHLGHWVTPSLSDMTFGYYPQGWYYIEVVGVSDCGTSEAWGTELECVDGNDLQNRMFSFVYDQSSAMLTVTLNPASERSQGLSRNQSLSGSASAGNYEVQLWNENTLLRSYKATDAQLQIPMSGMKSGLYVVRAVKDGKTQQRKLIKK